MSTVRAGLFVAGHTQNLAVGKRIATTGGNRSFVMGFPSVRAVVVSAKVKHKPLGASACVAVSVGGTLALATTAGSLPCLPYRQIRKSHFGTSFLQRQLTKATKCDIITLRSRAPNNPLVLFEAVIGASRWRLLSYTYILPHSRKHVNALSVEVFSIFRHK